MGEKKKLPFGWPEIEVDKTDSESLAHTKGHGGEAWCSVVRVTEGTKIENCHAIIVWRIVFIALCRFCSIGSSSGTVHRAVSHCHVLLSTAQDTQDTAPESDCVVCV